MLCTVYSLSIYYRLQLTTIAVENENIDNNSDGGGSTNNNNNNNKQKSFVVRRQINNAP